jgi:hypothetical protein
MDRRAFFLFLFSATILFQAAGQTITGRVVTTASAAIPDANVSLIVRGLPTTTDASGPFTLDIPSGKLTHSWPGAIGRIPINSVTSYTDDPKGSGGTPQFEYSYGLTY